MPTLNVDIDINVINPCYRPYLSDTHYTQIFYGGSSSGKSYFLAQRLVIDMLKGQHNYLVLRKVARTLRKSTFNEVCKAISFFKVSSLFTVNKSDLVITGPNGYQVLFGGMDDPEKIKSITPSKGVITDIWCEEATEFAYEDIKQLQKRLRGVSAVAKRIILSFNPIYQLHWIYKTYFAGHWLDDSAEYHDDMLAILKTTYRDNKFLTQDDIKALEAETDPYYKSVYNDGNWGVLGKTIFTNWVTISHQEMQEKAKTFSSFENGLDFGFANDPSALTHSHYDQRSNILYIVDAKYAYGFTNDLLAKECTDMFGNDLVVCDAAEPKSIEELRRYGVNTTAAKKGKDSINFGIQWLQHLKIVVDETLTGVVNELTVYKWKEDKDGNALPVPVDKENHYLDSIRYAEETNMGWSGMNRESIMHLRIPIAGAL